MRELAPTASNAYGADLGCSLRIEARSAKTAINVGPRLCQLHTGFGCARSIDEIDLKGASVRVFGLPGVVMIACLPALTSGGAVGLPLAAPPSFQIPAD